MMVMMQPWQLAPKVRPWGIEEIAKDQIHAVSPQKDAEADVDAKRTEV
jgi:hypothetical protein